MSIFDDEMTLCARADNKCKRRKKCWRHEAPRTEKFWEGDYYGQFKEFCNYFQDMSSEKYY